jgi:ribosomal-protein-alanine N-acetyltransferase
MSISTTRKVTRIRRARLADARQIALMSRQEIEHGLRWSWTPDRIRAAIRSPNNVVLAAVRGRRLCGFALLQVVEDCSHLCLLAVAPGFRRQGLARQLIRRLIQLSREQGCRKMQLEMRLCNLEARALYRTVGFRLISHIANYYENQEPAAVMRLDLAPQPGLKTQPSAPAFCA